MPGTLLIQNHLTVPDGKNLPRSLEVAARILLAESPDEIILLMESFTERGRRYADCTMRGALSPESQIARVDQPIWMDNFRAEARLRRDSIIFEGDDLPPQGPPFAWVQLWGGVYADIYGEYAPWTLVRAAYTVWDKKRWEGLKAEGLVVKQWELWPGFVQTIEEEFGWSPLSDGRDRDQTTSS